MTYNGLPLICSECADGKDTVDLEVLKVREECFVGGLYKEFFCQCPVCKRKFVGRVWYQREDYETENVESFPDTYDEVKE